MTTVDLEWHDARRGRTVPVRVRRAAADGPAPVVLLSPGLGATREGYAGLGAHLAARGFLVVHVQHPGTDRDGLREMFRGAPRPRARHAPTTALGVPPETGFNAALFTDAMARMLRDPRPVLARTDDLAFVLDRLAADPEYAPAARTDRVLVAGHSLGTLTALAFAGLVADLPGWPPVARPDPRVAAVIAMSPQGSGRLGLDAHSWDAIRVPVLLLCGTRDGGAAGEPPSWRREPFGRLPGEVVMVTVDGGHLVFAGPEDPSRATPAERCLLEASALFADAVLRGDPVAGAALRAGAVGPPGACTVENRDPR